MTPPAARTTASPAQPAGGEPTPHAPNLIPLETVVRLARNVKAHDIGALDASVNRFGFLEPITVNATTGHMIAGHGRADLLQQAKASGKKAPKGVTVSSGSWLVPVHYVQLPESEEEAAAIALNRAGELGGWDDAGLAQVLSDLAAQDALVGTGFDADDVDALLKRLGEDAPGQDESGRLKSSWEVLVSCADESSQRQLLDRLTAEGYECRAMIV
jgi:ParB-like chromosome segregation protein Spo0J